MFTKEIFLYFGVIFCTLGRIPGISMSHFFYAYSDGRGHPTELPDGVTPALDDQEDPSLRLIEKIQAGIDVDENYGKLYDLHHQKIIRFFRRKRFSPEENRDLTQEVFSRVFQGIATFRRESRFERWLFEIAANVYRNELRRRGAEKRDAVEVSINVSPEEEGGSAQVVEPVSQEQSALDAMIKRERSARLRSELQKLPLQMRTCCVLRYERGMKYQEIATVMKISIETVKAHLHQARKRLIERLGGDSPGDGPKGGGRP
jgi:RNA polymerase sigma-70 factor (ECF subfamily)